MAQEWLRGHQKTDTYGYMSLNWEIAKGLELLGRTQINSYNIFRSEKFPYSGTTYGREQAKGDYREDKRTLFENNTDFLLSLNKELSSNFKLKASLGGNLRSFIYNSSYGTTDYLNVPGWYNFANSLNPVRNFNFEAPMSVLSGYGFADLTFKNYLTLSVTGRVDKHSTLPESNNKYFYPSVGLSAVISEMIKFPAPISYFRVRGSYANVGSALTSSVVGPVPSISITGNPLGYGSTYLSPYGGPSYINAPVYSTQLLYNNQPAAFYTNAITNPNLEPSFSSAWETGFDLKLLKDRIGLDFTYFESLDGPGIYNLPISEASGYTTAIVNGIKTERRGMEIVLNANAVNSPSGFRWDIAVNWSTFKEYVNEIYGDIANYTQFIQVGERIDQIWGSALVRKSDGTPIIGSDGRAIPISSINGNARRFLGYANPDWSYGINNVLSYKNFSFSFQFDGRVGGRIEDYVQKQTFRGGRHIATVQGEMGEARYQDYLGVKSYVGEGVNLTSGAIKIDQEGNITNESELTFNSGNTNATFLQDWISRYYNTNETNMISRTFSKLREVIFTYNIPSSALSKTFINRASVSFVGRNLLYFAEKKDIDIEQYGGYEGGSGLQTPTTRRYGLNLNITF
jgi:hypothetical protein